MWPVWRVSMAVFKAHRLCEDLFGRALPGVPPPLLLAVVGRDTLTEPARDGRAERARGEMGRFDSMSKCASSASSA